MRNLGLRQAQRQAPEKRRSRVWLWGILAVLLLAVAAVYAWDLLRPSSSPAATPAVPGVTAPAATRPPSSDGAGAAVPGVEQATRPA